METSFHPMTELFAQLGLPNSPKSIESFIKQHPLNEKESLFEASFWNKGQRDFLHQAISNDSDWAEIVDQLDVRLRESN
tara:strand:+ start:48 stop:284 length:237 start_codon:yes stop_codon:yes gene_type:complete